MASSPPDPGRRGPLTRLQLALRWVWLAIGVVLLVLLLWVVVFMVRESAGGGGGAISADSARKDSARAARVEPLRYDLPDTIHGSATRIVQIRRGTGYRYSSRAESRAVT